MWASLFATAVAAAVCLSAVNLASEINKIQEARHLAVVEHSAPFAAPPSERAIDATGSANQKRVLEHGA